LFRTIQWKAFVRLTVFAPISLFVCHCSDRGGRRLHQNTPAAPDRGGGQEKRHASKKPCTDGMAARHACSEFNCWRRRGRASGDTRNRVPVTLVITATSAGSHFHHPRVPQTTSVQTSPPGPPVAIPAGLHVMMSIPGKLLFTIKRNQRKKLFMAVISVTKCFLANNMAQNVQRSYLLMTQGDPGGRRPNAARALLKQAGTSKRP